MQGIKTQICKGNGPLFTDLTLSFQLQPVDAKTGENIASANAGNNFLTLNSQFAKTLNQSHVNSLTLASSATTSDQITSESEQSLDEVQGSSPANQGGGISKTFPLTPGSELPLTGMELPLHSDSSKASVSLKTQGTHSQSVPLYTQGTAEAADQTSLQMDQIDLALDDVRYNKETPANLDGRLTFAERAGELSTYSPNLGTQVKSAVTSDTVARDGATVATSVADKIQQQSQTSLPAQSVSGADSVRAAEVSASIRPSDTLETSTTALRTPATLELGLQTGQAQGALVKANSVSVTSSANSLSPDKQADLTQNLQNSNALNGKGESREAYKAVDTRQMDASLTPATTRTAAEGVLLNPPKGQSPGNVADTLPVSGSKPPQESVLNPAERPVGGQHNVVDPGKASSGMQLQSNRDRHLNAGMPSSPLQAVADLQPMERDYQVTSVARLAMMDTNSALEVLSSPQRQALNQNSAIHVQASVSNPVMAAWVNRETGADTKTNTDFHLTVSSSGLKAEAGSTDKPGVANQTAGAASSATAMHKALGEAVSDQLMRAVSRQALTNGRFTLQLNPRELGAVDIEFSTERGELQLAVVVRETATRELLENNLSRLRQNLQEAGVNLGELDVRQEQHKDQGESTDQRQAQSASLAAPGQVQETTGQHPPTPSNERLFDIYV